MGRGAQVEGAGGQGQREEAQPCRVLLRYLHHLQSGYVWRAAVRCDPSSGTGSILAIAASTPKVVQQKNGHFGVRKSMTVTITCDHRHIYGADAAGFLADLANLIENRPKDMLMGLLSYIIPIL